MSSTSRERLVRLIADLPAARPLIGPLEQTAGVHLVGGAVRDLLLGGTPVDLDLVVDGELAPVCARLGGVVRTHERFGTCTVELGGRSYDLARSRRERYPQPGALPEVEPAPLEEDLLRRDFTVNAIAIELGGERAGELHSAPGALGDLDARTLRVLHEHSFEDDPTRMLRLARYRSRLGFEVEPGTRRLVERALETSALDTVSGSRIGAELRLALEEPDPLAAFATLRQLGLDAAIEPGFGVADQSLARRALELLGDDDSRDRLVLALASMAVSPGELAPMLDRLAFEAGDRDAVISAASHVDSLARELDNAHRPSEIAAAVGAAGPELVALAGALGPADAAREWLERLRGIGLDIDGGDLLAAGVPEGPAIGAGLRAALGAKLDGRTDGRDDELAYALAAAAAQPEEQS